MAAQQFHPPILGVSAFTLTRYPPKHDKSLRAWDAADEYLLKEILPLLNEQSRVLIVNDQFGCLALALRSNACLAYSDSWMSHKALQINAQANGLPMVAAVSDLDSDEVAQFNPTLVIGKAPKTKAVLKEILLSLKRVCANGTPLFLSGMEKHLSKGVFDELETHWGAASFTLGWRKARVWRSDKAPVTDEAYGQIVWQEEALKLHIHTNGYIFNHQGLDHGSRFFIAHFDQLPAAENVIDLACGSGVLGLSYWQYHNNTQVTFIDESFQAVKVASQNAQANGCDNVGSIWGDGLRDVESNSQTLIVCNPPFHQQTAVTTAIAEGFFKDAKRVLKANGEMWVVANRHLGYHKSMKKWLGQAQVVASNSKFVIIRGVNT